jgi:aldose 1-epimerase
VSAVGSHEAFDESADGFEGVALLSREAELRAAFAPSAGMVGYSLTHRDEELLGQVGGMPAYVERGSTFGLPLLHPWANRLAAWSYELHGRHVQLTAEGSPVHLDENGLPIHGLVAASPHWDVIGRTSGNGHVAIAARLDYGARDELMAGFPFPHELHVQAELRDDTLTVVTILLPTGSVPVPVAFGWHPYLRLPGVPRSEFRLELPVRRRALLDGRGIPTGESEPFSWTPGPLGESTFDDLFDELEEPARFVLEGGGRRIELELADGYSVAQVYAPPGKDFVCFEPMTAPTNALLSGDRLRSVDPSESFSAKYTITVCHGA